MQEAPKHILNILVTLSSFIFRSKWFHFLKCGKILSWWCVSCPAVWLICLSNCLINISVMYAGCFMDWSLTAVKIFLQSQSLTSSLSLKLKENLPHYGPDCSTGWQLVQSGDVPWYLLTYLINLFNHPTHKLQYSAWIFLHVGLMPRFWSCPPNLVWDSFRYLKTVTVSFPRPNITRSFNFFLHSFILYLFGKPLLNILQFVTTFSLELNWSSEWSLTKPD